MDYLIKKFKARLCVRGDVQKRRTEEPMDTYAPVVQWSTVHLMLILIQIMKLKTLSFDFSNAFAQAECLLIRWFTCICLTDLFQKRDLERGWL